MSDWHYEKDGDEFVFLDGDGNEVQRCVRLSIGYVEDQMQDGGHVMMCKHGSPEMVVGWAHNRNRRIQESGLAPEMKYKTIDVTDWPLERINACIQICDRFAVELNTIDIKGHSCELSE